MRRLHLTVLAAIALSTAWTGLAHAAVYTYTASAAPGASPDANGNTVDVWTMTSVNTAGNFAGNSGSNGDGNGAGAGNPAWAIWANAGGQSAAEASITTLVGRSLTLAGDSVSLDFDNGWVETTNGPNFVGVQFYSGTTLATELSFEGGTSSYKLFDAAGIVTTNVGFTDDGFNLKVELTDSGGGYNFTLGANTFTGRTLAGAATSLTAVRVFNFGAGGNDGGAPRDVFFNNLVITAVPEVSSAAACALAGIASGLGVAVRGRMKKRGG